MHEAIYYHGGKVTTFFLVSDFLCQFPLKLVRTQFKAFAK